MEDEVGKFIHTVGSRDVRTVQEQLINLNSSASLSSDLQWRALLSLSGSSWKCHYFCYKWLWGPRDSKIGPGVGRMPAFSTWHLTQLPPVFVFLPGSCLGLLPIFWSSTGGVSCGAWNGRLVLDPRKVNRLYACHLSFYNWTFF